MLGWPKRLQATELCSLPLTLKVERKFHVFRYGAKELSSEGWQSFNIMQVEVTLRFQVHSENPKWVEYCSETS